MDSISILSVLMGVVILATRGPLLFAPKATLAWYRRICSTKGNVRSFGLGLLVLSLALLIPTLGDGLMAAVLQFFGLVFAVVAVWLLLAPGSYQVFVEAIFDFIESSVDEAIIRMAGMFAVVIGIAMIYAGAYVV